MGETAVHPVVHLELHTANLPRACRFYTALFGWCAELTRYGDERYLALTTGETLEVGVVEREVETALWLPYVEVECIDEAIERARRLGAEVAVEAREGPAGWRSVLIGPASECVALWQRKA